MANKYCSLMLLCIAVVSLSATYLLAQEPTAPKSTPKPITYVAPTKENYLKFADEAEKMLRQDILGKWFPACVDNVNGGFNASFDREWKPGKSKENFPVFQERITGVPPRGVMGGFILKKNYL